MFCDLPTQRVARARLERSEASKRAASNHCGRASGGSARSGGCGTGRGVIWIKGGEGGWATSAGDEKPGRRTDSLGRSRFGIRRKSGSEFKVLWPTSVPPNQCLHRLRQQGEGGGLDEQGSEVRSIKNKTSLPQYHRRDHCVCVRT